MYDWQHKRVLITGGASFIGSHLVDALVARGARVKVADDLSSGSVENIWTHIRAGRVSFVRVDLRIQTNCEMVVKGAEVVFHLAAAHGGRGYVDLHQAACAENMLLDQQVFRACREAGVEKVVYASSGCVYPNSLQTDPGAVVYLTEDMVGPPYDADNMYGWAKLMGEKTLRAYYRDYGLKSASLRYFTVYGRRGRENHAVLAFIARAFIGQDPFEVWGDGQQIRNWTHVSDIVAGTILAAERVSDGTAINLGTKERVRVIDAVKQVLALMGHNPSITFLSDMPVGPANRVADNSLAWQVLGWKPRVKFEDGLADTVKWYCEVKGKEEVRQLLEGGGLVER